MPARLVCTLACSTCSTPDSSTSDCSLGCYHEIVPAIRSSAAVMLLLVSGALSARDYGPSIGSQMPDFELRDQDGKTYTLTSLLGPTGAVILFFRSADW